MSRLGVWTVCILMFTCKYSEPLGEDVPRCNECSSEGEQLTELINFCSGPCSWSSHRALCGFSLRSGSLKHLHALMFNPKSGLETDCHTAGDEERKGLMGARTIRNTDAWRNVWTVTFVSFILFVQPSICASGPCRIKRGWSWQIMRRWVLHLEVLTPRTDQLMNLWAGVHSLSPTDASQWLSELWNASRSWLLTPKIWFGWKRKRASDIVCIFLFNRRT